MAETNIFCGKGGISARFWKTCVNSVSRDKEWEKKEFLEKKKRSMIIKTPMVPFLFPLLILLHLHGFHEKYLLGTLGSQGLCKNHFLIIGWWMLLEFWPNRMISSFLCILEQELREKKRSHLLLGYQKINFAVVDDHDLEKYGKGERKKEEQEDRGRNEADTKGGQYHRVRNWWPLCLWFLDVSKAQLHFCFWIPWNTVVSL